MTLPVTRRGEPRPQLQTACERILDIVSAAWGIDALDILDANRTREPKLQAARCMFAHYASEYVGSRPLTGRLVWNGTRSRQIIDSILIQMPKAKNHPRWQTAAAMVEDAVGRIK